MDIRTPLRHNIHIMTLITPTSTATVGQKGEQIAYDFLVANGYKMYKRNVRIGHDEIDIIAYDPSDKCLVFTEVKTRSNASNFFNPMLNIDTKKRRAMFRAARLFNAYHDYNGAYRLDVISVVGNTVTEHLQEISAE